MTAEIVRLVPQEAGDAFRLEADAVLDGAKGRDYHRLVVIGQIEGEDDLYVAGTDNAGESLILMEWAKLQIINR